MKIQAFAMAAVLGLVLTAGSAQAGVWSNGVQLNGMPASGFTVETVELPDGAVAMRKGGCKCD